MSITRSFSFSFFNVNDLYVTRSFFGNFLSGTICTVNLNMAKTALYYKQSNLNIHVDQSIFFNITTLSQMGAVYVDAEGNSNLEFTSNQFISCECKDMNGMGAAMCLRCDKISINSCCARKCMAGITTAIQILESNMSLFYINNTNIYECPGRSNVFGISSIDISVPLTAGTCLNFSHNSHPSITSFYVYLSGISFCVRGSGLFRYMHVSNNMGGTTLLFKSRQEYPLTLEYGNVINNSGSADEQIMFVSAPTNLINFSFIDNSCSAIRVSDITLSGRIPVFILSNCYFDNNLRTFACKNTGNSTNIFNQRLLIPFYSQNLLKCDYWPPEKEPLDLAIYLGFMIVILIFALLATTYRLRFKGKEVELLSQRITLDDRVANDFG